MLTRRNFLKAAVVGGTGLASLGLIGCSSSNSSSSSSTSSSSSSSESSSSEAESTASEALFTTQYTIGVVVAAATDETTTQQWYAENVLADAYNVKFIFSDVISDVSEAKTFVENCIDAGADAIIDFYSGDSTVVQLCADNQIYYAYQAPKSSPKAQTLVEVWKDGDFGDYFCGFCGFDNAASAYVYTDWLNENASDDGSEGFLILSSMASSSNIQHLTFTEALLDGIAEKYDLTYEEDVTTLAMKDSIYTVPNDKDILITIYPGASTSDTWLPGVTALLQTGNYGVLASVANTVTTTATTVKEVEASLNQNISVMGCGTFGDTLVSEFSTLDQFGNPSVDLEVCTWATLRMGELFALVYNGLTGYTDLMVDSTGEPTELLGLKVGITSYEDLEATLDWDVSGGDKWTGATEIIDQLLGVCGATSADEMEAYILSVDYDYLVDLLNG